MASQNKVSEFARRRGRKEQKRRTVEWAWEIPLYLAQQGDRTTAQLAEIFHVSKRTITNLLGRLYTIGVPVELRKVPGHAVMAWRIDRGVVQNMFYHK